MDKKNTESFNTKIKEIDGGIIERDFLGQPKDIVHDHVYHIKKDNYKKIRQDRLDKEECMKKEGYAFSNISDDRFINYEQSLFKEDLNHKREQLRLIGVSYMGANGCLQGFGQRDRRILQHSNDEKGVMNFKEQHQKSTILGRHDVNLDMVEDKKQGNDALQNLGENTPENKIYNRLNFDKILEYEIRDKYNLMGGRGEDVGDYIEKAKLSYIKNDVRNAGSINNSTGKYQGGHQRINYLNQAQNNNNQKDESFTFGSSTRIDINKYYYDYGNKKKSDVIIEKLEEDEDDKYLTIPI